MQRIDAIAIVLCKFTKNKIVWKSNSGAKLLDHRREFRHLSNTNNVIAIDDESPKV